ncbi:hypothetical protein N7468_002143 [Penicillium chermesinum]|uniref:Serine hydrolase domain-containing protein n=1 Tax=Penicillium chermesinum TaxID=63820 RepID=A0A9W9PHY7_9EURO|nr:uncharacterized protein N7468_002143 [Penicillium chermesinum]KAJ5247160.1 hypothetical protein N7468_002143 [Penicillium chermesinum]KAJ6145403.1 hypothetical protein N7470_009298 [Penicillium chermesinum]
MKFLCLPGGFSSAKTLQTQLGPLCEALESHGDAKFHFTQGSVPMYLPDSVQGFFGPPPNFSFAKVDRPDLVNSNLRGFPKRDTPEASIKCAWEKAGNPSFSCIASVMDDLIKILENDNEIEGVMGYSEGAEIAATLLLEEQRRYKESGRIPRLKCAVFLSGWPPVEPVTGGCILADDFEDEVIKIPTCHILGAADPFLDGAMALYNMCDPDTADIFDHGGGHVIPRNRDVVHQVGEVIQEMISSVEVGA